MEFTVSFDKKSVFRGGSRTAATSKMDHFVIIVNGFQYWGIFQNWGIFQVKIIKEHKIHRKSIAFHKTSNNICLSLFLLFGFWPDHT